MPTRTKVTQVSYVHSQTDIQPRQTLFLEFDPSFRARPTMRVRGRLGPVRNLSGLKFDVWLTWTDAQDNPVRTLPDNPVQFTPGQRPPRNVGWSCTFGQTNPLTKGEWYLLTARGVYRAGRRSRAGNVVQQTIAFQVPASGVVLF